MTVEHYILSVIAMDVSADLTELGRTPVTVISSGVKSILDIRKTLEYLVTSVTIRHSVNLSTHKHSSVIFLYTIIIVKNYQKKNWIIWYPMLHSDIPSVCVSKLACTFILNHLYLDIINLWFFTQETEGVAVATYGTSQEFPAFFTPHSGFKVPYNVTNPTQAAHFIGRSRIQIQSDLYIN